MMVFSQSNTSFRPTLYHQGVDYLVEGGLILLLQLLCGILPHAFNKPRLNLLVYPILYLILPLFLVHFV